MPTLLDSQTPSQQLRLAVRTRTPARLAQTFAAYEGQFYDRASFDALAREARALYAVQDPEEAATFQDRLDRRLCDRYRAPVTWDVAPAPTSKRAA